MDNRAIGVFDSGVGGLSALREIRRLLPNENLIYFGDTARIPYGTRSNETIIEYASEDMNFLLSKDVKMIAVACGTVSAIAIDRLRAACPVPIYEVITPAVDRALELTKNKRIGVFGTPATIKSGAYGKRISAVSCEIEKVCEKACPILVPLIENGYIGHESEITRLALREYLDPIKESGSDTLILGCTHYPLISNLILEEWGGGEVVNTGLELARTIERECSEKGFCTDRSEEGKTEIYSSDDIIGQAGMFLSEEIMQKADFIGKIAIEEYK